MKKFLALLCKNTSRLFCSLFKLVANGEVWKGKLWSYLQPICSQFLAMVKVNGRAVVARKHRLPYYIINYALIYKMLYVCAFRVEMATRLAPMIH